MARGAVAGGAAAGGSVAGDAVAQRSSSSRSLWLWGSACGDQHERSGDVPGIALSWYVWQYYFQQVGRAQLAVCDRVAVFRKGIAPLASRAQLGLELQCLPDRRLWHVEVRIDALFEKPLATLEVGWDLVAEC